MYKMIRLSTLLLGVYLGFSGLSSATTKNEEDKKDYKIYFLNNLIYPKLDPNTKKIYEDEIQRQMVERRKNNPYEEPWKIPIITIKF